MIKTKVGEQTYIDSCNTILESTMSDKEKLASLMEYASQFEPILFKESVWTFMK